MVSACSAPQEPVAPNLLSEARSIRTKNPQTHQLDLADVAQKYIPVGTPKEVALKYLRDLGFDVIQIPDKPEEYMAQKRELPPPGVLPGSDEYRVNLRFADEKVTRSWGWLFLHLL